MSLFQRILATYARIFAGLPKEIWFLAFVMLVNRSGSMVLPFLSLYVHEDLGYQASSAGVMIVAYGIGSSIGTFLGGPLTEWLGPIRVQLVSLLGNAIGFVLLSQMRSYWSFAAVLLLQSIIADALRPANGIAIARYAAPELRARAFALNRLAINLGFTIGPSIGGVLASISFQWLFWIDAATCALAAALLWRLLASADAEHADRSPGDAGKVAEAEAGSPWLDLRFLLFLTLTLITYMVFFQLLAILPLFLSEEFRLAKWQIGFMYGLNTIIVVLFEMLLVDALQHKSPLRCIAWGSLLMCEGFALLNFGQGLFFTIFCVLVWTVGEMLAMPQGMNYVSSVSGSRSRTRYMSAFTTAIALAWVVGPMLGAWCYRIDHYLFWKICLPIGIMVFLGLQWLANLPTRQLPSISEDVR